MAIRESKKEPIDELEDLHKRPPAVIRDLYDEWKTDLDAGRLKAAAARRRTAAEQEWRRELAERRQATRENQQLASSLQQLDTTLDETCSELRAPGRSSTGRVNKRSRSR